jgi:hypothetical protein
MNGQVIGKTMNNGFAGSYSRQPDMIIDAHAVASEITFGEPVVYKGTQVESVAEALKASDLTASTVAGAFVGVGAAEIKSATEYLTSGAGKYHLGDIAAVLKRGRVNVICQKGTPALNGDVYVRVEANTSYPTAVVGGFEAAADSTKTVKLTNAKWRGAADGNGVAELSILTQINA